MTLTAPGLDPATALDGSASARRGGRWLAGCSVPRRAAELMIRNERWPGRSLCLITPTHAQQVAATLARLGPTKAVIVVLASPCDWDDFAACVDFSAERAAGRLHVAWDEPTLRNVFDRHTGLAVPQQMARLPDADPDAAKRTIAWAQPLLGTLASEHARRLTDAASRPAAGGRCVFVGRQFKLWNDSGDTLARALDDAGAYDTDRPTNGSEAAAAEAVAGKAVVVADRPRPAWAASVTAWVAWAARPCVPAFDARHPRDALLLADDAWRPLARAAGWPEHRLALAGPPVMSDGPAAGAAPALMLDLPDLAVPDDFEDVTARRLVWEAIRDELTRDPFAVGDDAAAYVARAPARLGLPADAGLPVDRYVAAIVSGAFAVGVARWLAREGVPFTLHGHGWVGEGELAGRWRGPVTDRTDCRARIAASGGLIDVSLPHANPFVAATGVPVVRPFGRAARRVLQDVADVRAGRTRSSVTDVRRIDRATIDRLVR